MRTQLCRFRCRGFVQSRMMGALHDHDPGSALPGAGVAGVWPELHVNDVHSIAVHVGVRVDHEVYKVARMQRHLHFYLQHRG